MAKYEFYRKRGNLNYRERSMLEDISKRLEGNPSLSKDIVPVDNIEDLKQLHSKIMSDVAEVIEEVTNDELPKAPTGAKEIKNPFIDPLNRESPIINDYVMDDKFDPFADYEKSKKNSKTFAEPTNYDQAFEIPDEDEIMAQRKSIQNPKQKGHSHDEEVSHSPAPNRRKAKRFASSLVNITCRLLEVGFVWYATKDINEQKLAEYELSGEMDLSLIIELPSGQEATIKEFFINQIPEIEQASKVSPQAKEDLIEALTELFIERNIQPSASYDAIIAGVSLLAEQGIKLAVIVQQNNAILNQLRQRGATQPPQQRAYYPTPEEQAVNEALRQNQSPVKDETEFFTVDPVAQTSTDEIMLDEEDMDEEMKNDVNLLKEYETKE